MKEIIASVVRKISFVYFIFGVSIIRKDFLKTLKLLQKIVNNVYFKSTLYLV